MQVPTRPAFMKKIRESEVSQHAPPSEPVIPLIPKPKKVKVPPSIMTEEKVETFGSWFMGSKSTPAPAAAQISAPTSASGISTLLEPPRPPPPLELERPPKAEPTESLNEGAMVANIQGGENKDDSSVQQHDGPEGPASPSPSFTSPRSQFLLEREALFSLPATRSVPFSSTSPKKRLDLNLLARNEKTHKKEWLEKLRPAPPKENITGRCIYSMKPNERDLLFAPPLLKST